MAARISKAVELGFVRYVIHVGVQSWGFSLFVFTCLYEVLKNNSIDEMDLIFRLLACTIGGMLWGVGMWNYENRKD